ncbi:glycoside hydrolase N-terminal domain-containing protein [Streptomyces sp. NPDC006285]|uniref:glycoside hydrolase family 95 protein n=1 Tax=Streptomyces sp. NPDC006285 TaxID=3364742 RepID=UPI00368551E4
MSFDASASSDVSADDSSVPSPGPTSLWYAAPAADWEREALPIGNGALGAMVFGTLASERLQFNEKTLWTGGPGSVQGYDHGNWRTARPGALTAVRERIDAGTRLDPDTVAAELGQSRVGYGAHQIFGDLHIDVPDAPTAPPDTYRRALDLADAVATVVYTHRQVRHQREFFASYPDGVLVGRLSADRPGSVTCTFRHSSPRDDYTATAAGGRLTVRGTLADNGLRFEAQLRVHAEGGTVTSHPDGTIGVTGADSAWFVLAAGTDYADTYPEYRGEDPHAAVTRAVDQAGDSYGTLRARHVRDHRALFGRVALDLRAEAPDIPTDRLLADYTGGTTAATAGIVEMLLQSQHDVIEILPALPAAWRHGSVRGLRARGGATVGIDWADGRATRVTVTASRARRLTVRSGLLPDGGTTFRAVAGRRYVWSARRVSDGPGSGSRAVGA